MVDKIAEVKIDSIMTSDVYKYDESTTVRMAMDTLVQKGISGAPLVDAKGRLLTIVSEFDLMQLGALGKMDEKLIDVESRFKPRDELLTCMKIDTFKDVFKIFLQNRIRRIVVIDNSDIVQGVVSRRDIIRTFLDQN